MNAHDFVLSLADQLVEQGRTVEIEEEPDSIRIYARPRSISEYTIAAHAFTLPGSGRWNFGAIRAYGIFGDPIVEKRRKYAYIIVDVYGRSYLPKEVTV